MYSAIVIPVAVFKSVDRERGFRHLVVIGRIVIPAGFSGEFWCRSIQCMVD